MSLHNMIGNFALILWLLTLIVYFIFTVAIFYHFKKYTISSGQRRTFLSVFSIVSLVLFIANFIIFSQIDWNKISEIFSTSVKGLGG